MDLESQIIKEVLYKSDLSIKEMEIRENEGILVDSLIELTEFSEQEISVMISNLKIRNKRNFLVTIQVDGTAALYSFLNRGRRTSLFLTDL